MGASQSPMGDASDFSANSQPSGKKSDFSANSQPSGSKIDFSANSQPLGSKIDDIYNQLSDDDKKATEKYAQSLLDRSEENGAAAEVGESPDNAGGMPMQEVYVMREGKLVPGRIGYRRKNRK